MVNGDGADTATGSGRGGVTPGATDVATESGGARCEPDREPCAAGSRAGTETMHCNYCYREFEPDPEQEACRACPLKKGCRFYRCPHCGWDNPVTPGWVERVRAWWEGEREAER